MKLKNDLPWCTDDDQWGVEVVAMDMSAVWCKVELTSGSSRLTLAFISTACKNIFELGKIRSFQKIKSTQSYPKCYKIKRKLKCKKLYLLTYKIQCMCGCVFNNTLRPCTLTSHEFYRNSILVKCDDILSSQLI